MWILPVFALAVLAGCTSVGPKTVTVDRSDYGNAIAESWKEQALLNIVKVRYMDLPVFMDVSSVVAGYSLQTGVTVGGVFNSGSGAPNSYGSLGGQAVYTDRPTITYVPMTGEKFLRGLITPIDPKNIFFMLQSGYAADFILGLAVESLNGVRNGSTAGGVVREADPDFVQALRLLRDIQEDGALGMRVEEDKVKGTTGVVFFQRNELAPDLAEKTREVRRLLRLPPDVDRFTLTYSPMPGAPGELAVNSRSMMQIIGAFASYVEVPAAHREFGGTTPTASGDPADASARAARVHSGTQRPENAFAAVQYRGHWFWIDEGDWQTKRALVATNFFFTLADTGAGAQLPLITIPAQ
jgi:hypothetical protein